MSSAYVYEAVRVPVGRYGGALAAVRPDDLAAQVLQALVAGWPTHVTGVTVNWLCGSSLEAAVQASRAIEVGDATIIVAGGGESMSRSPWVMQKPSRAFPAGNETLHSSALGWRMVNPRMPGHHTISLGESTEKLAATYGIGPDTSLQKLAKLPAAFVDGGTLTAGNSSPLSDGAAAVLVADEGSAAPLGRAPLARIVARAAHGVDPDVFGIGPVQAANKVLSRAGLSWDQIDVVELNEAFAGQSLACLQAWPELDPEKVNQRGGAIAIGHPLGASGARILGRLAHELHARGDGYGRAGAALQPARRSRRPAERPRARSAGAPGVPVRGQ
ncbi:MAG: thiolase family protein, partial [Actinomycetota bacterium]|nr:thiolase family protein [Actinomycetota bacterium]